MRIYSMFFSIVISLVLGLTACNAQGQRMAAATPAQRVLPQTLPPIATEPHRPAANPRPELHAARDAAASRNASNPAAKRDALLAKSVLTLLQRHHLRQRPLDDATSEMTFDLFLSQLDPSKLYLTEVDVNRLRQHARELDDQLRQGQLTFANEAGVLRRARATLVAGWIDALLAQPFDFTRDEALEISGKKRAFSTDDAALRERWRRVLKYETLTLIMRAKTLAKGAPDAPTPAPDNHGSQTDADIEAEARKTLLKRYHTRFVRVAQEDHRDDLDRFMNAFVQAYDPHTTYLPPYRRENLDIHMSGSLEGIGAVIRQDEGLVKVQRIVPGSASWRQGDLKAEDFILAVAQDGAEPTDVMDMRLQDAVQLIRGKKGTIVRLTVRKPDGNVVVIPITRDVVRLEETYAKAAVLENKDIAGRFAYIYLPKFYGDVRSGRSTTPVRRASEDIQQALAQLASEDIRGLILDVRSNGGGLLTESVRVSGLFIPQGPIVQTRNTTGKQKTLEDRDGRVAFTGPVVVLVDRFSASASEILAAALQDYGRAVVVGSVTHGKGTVQHLQSLDSRLQITPGSGAEMSPLGTLKLTRSQFYRINGGSTQLRGVTPDVPLPDAAAHLDTGEQSRQHAIPWNTIDPLAYTPWSAPWDVQSLRAQSLARQANNAAFTKIQTQTALLKKMRDNTVESLEKTGWLQRRERENAQLEALKLDDQARFHVRPVPYASNTAMPLEAQAEVEAEWVKDVQDDPWIEEALRIVNNMAHP